MMRGLKGAEFLAEIPGSLGGSFITDAFSSNQYLRNIITQITYAIPRGNDCVMETCNWRELENSAQQTISQAAKNGHLLLLKLKLRLWPLVPEQIIRQTRVHLAKYQRLSQLYSIGYGNTDGLKQIKFDKAYQCYQSKDDPNIVIFKNKPASSSIVGEVISALWGNNHRFNLVNFND